MFRISVHETPKPENLNHKAQKTQSAESVDVKLFTKETSSAMWIPCIPCTLAQECCKISSIHCGTIILANPCIYPAPMSFLMFRISLPNERFELAKFRLFSMAQACAACDHHRQNTKTWSQQAWGKGLRCRA